MSKEKENRRHNLIKMPREVRKSLVTKVSFTFIETALITSFAYSMQLCNWGIKNSMSFVAAAALVVYLLRDMFKSLLSSFFEGISAEFDANKLAYLASSVAEAVNSVSGKVYTKTESGILELIPTAKIKDYMKSYIEAVWGLKEQLPAVVIDIVMALAMTVTVIFTVDFDLKLVIGLIICIVVQIINYFKIGSLDKPYLKKVRLLGGEMSAIDFDLTRTKINSKREFRYKVGLIKKNGIASVELAKSFRISINNLRMIEEFFKFAFLIWMVYEKTGFIITAETLTDILAVMAIYTSLLEKIQTILRKLEGVKRSHEEILSYSEDVYAILKRFDKENQKTTIDGAFDKILINPFEFSYPSGKSNYTLRNEKKIEIEPGDIIEVRGESGCGKTTALRLISGEIVVDDNSLVTVEKDGISKSGYISTVFQDAEPVLGSQSILDEITLGEQLDADRLITLLKGVKIYNDLAGFVTKGSDIDEEIIKYLKENKENEFSRGQMQRLYLVKNLYNLKSQQILVFDEATGALNAENARAVFKFICEYVKSVDEKKVIFLISHQPELVEDLANKHFNFDLAERPVSKLIAV